MVKQTDCRLMLLHNYEEVIVSTSHLREEQFGGAGAQACSNLLKVFIIIQTDSPRHCSMTDNLSDLKALTSAEFENQTGKYKFCPVCGLPKQVELEIWNRHHIYSNPMDMWGQVVSN